tara:strand:+ start:1741 stop:1956 length:216 start_codon:yes stop_codon:yes gene_type:complete
MVINKDFEQDMVRNTLMNIRAKIGSYLEMTDSNNPLKHMLKDDIEAYIVEDLKEEFDRIPRKGSESSIGYN